MHKLLPLLLLPSLASAGELIGWQANVDGRTRTWITFEPTECPAEGCPVVFHLHGGGGSGETLLSQTQLHVKAEAEGWIIVAPDSWHTRRGFNSWNYGDTLPPWLTGFGGVQTVDDVRFLNLLSSWVDNNFPANPARTFSTGVSAGGAMSYRWACRSPSVEAIFVTATSKHTAQCSSDAALSHLHGGADTNVPLEGNDTFPPVQEGIDFWRTQTPDVYFHVEPGAGHTWAIVPNTNEVLADFIAAH